MVIPAILAPAPIDDVTAPRRRMHSALVLFLIWTAVGVFFGLQRYVDRLLFGGELPDARPMIAHLTDAYVWACLTPLIFGIARRYPLNPGTWVRTLPVHVPLAAAISLFSTTFNTGFGKLLWPEEPLSFRDYFGAFYFNIQWYAVIVVVWHAMDYARRARDREVQAAQMGARLAEARLEALKMQIQPHFLFNTLHSISELVHEDADSADRMIIRLGDLLRLTVDNAETHEVTLAQEMEFLEAYLEIQRTRFADTLEVDVDVPGEALDALVPNLVLQPLVENAIRHGVAARGGVGKIRISAARIGDRLRLEVRDNGVGLPEQPGPRDREGVGVKNTRARLEQMYGDRQQFELRNGSRGGAVASVVIPFRPAPAAEEEVPALAVEVPA